MTHANSPQPDDRKAIIALQEQLSFQQRQLDDLNAIVIEQRSRIDQLRGELAGLTTVVKSLMEHTGDNLPYEKPPHY